MPGRKPGLEAPPAPEARGLSGSAGPRVLVVEDERDLVRVLAYNLEQAGFVVVTAASGADALRAAHHERFDVVLLDVMLPDISGTEVCRRLRKEARTAQVPILVASAKGEEIDRVLGFELGADDYVVKPFSVRELVLRVQALLRRKRLGEARAVDVFEHGMLRVDRAAHRLWVEGAEIVLTAGEMRLLLLLYDRRGRVLSRESLLDDVGGAAALERNVDTRVKRLRDKLGKAGGYIETVRGVGYRFRPDDAP